MYLKILLLSFMLFPQAVSIMAQDENDVIAYIERYKNLAIAEQTRVGVPAAITLAQGIHESAAGKSELALVGNNHFGIKCKSNWTGETMLHDDDKKQECFRKYINTEQSYIDHSDFLRASNRYHFLFDMDITDYAGWASGLKRAGYATNPAYVKRLTDLVEKYNLQQYTYEAIAVSPIKPGEIIPEKDEVKSLTHVDDPSTFYKGLQGFWAKKGESLLPKALERNIRYAKLLFMNDLADEPLAQDMFVFTEKKRKVGTEEFHTVKEGEDMLMISQKEAIMLNMLYTYNNMIPGQEPEVGERLCLLYRIYGKPKIKQQFLGELKRNETEGQAMMTHQTERKIEQVVEPPKKEEISNEPIQTEAKIIPKSEPEKVTEPEKLVEQVVVQSIPEEEKKQEPVSTSVIEQKTIEQQQDILDEEKARRMEALLNSKPLDAPEPTKVANDTENNQAMPRQLENKVASITEDQKTEIAISSTQAQKVEEEVKEIVPSPKEEVKAVPVSQEPIVQKRSYDEVGIDDSVKSLKKKFDRIVYSPRPVKKVDTLKKVESPAVKPPEIKVPTATVKKEQAPTAKKIEEKKLDKSNQKKTGIVKKEDDDKKEDKKSTIQVTKTGIKRDAEKISAKEKAKEQEKAKNAKEKKATEKEKLDTKKNKNSKKADEVEKGPKEKGKKKVVDDKKKDVKKKEIEKPTDKKKKKEASKNKK